MVALAPPMGTCGLPSDRASGLRAGRSLGSTRWTVVFRTTVHLRELDGSRLPGASQEASRSAMVLKVDKLVALATVLPRNQACLLVHPATLQKVSFHHSITSDSCGGVRS